MNKINHLTHSLLNYFSQQPLDRVAHLRCKPEWLKVQADSPKAQSYLLNDNLIVCRGNQPICLSSGQIKKLKLDLSHHYFLGLKQHQPVFALNIDDLTRLGQTYQHCESLSALTDHIDSKIASMLAFALLISHWHSSTRFCVRCGSSLITQQGGHTQLCTNHECQHVEFPRINPAVIMRVTHGDKILLARQANWPQQRYSVLAGFVELGEPMESAVVREVFEETGLVVENLSYHSSQPWPFPNSLMIGYSAKARDTRLNLDNDDIETALWLSADELIKEMDHKNVILSPGISISYRLIEDWFFENTGRSIKDLHVKNKVEPILNEKN